MAKKTLFEDYEGFVEKFKPKKTTDDCYTPEYIYDAVRDWVAEKVDLSDKIISRPFYPGGDFENETYTPNTVVIDNPPFSIMARIIRFYLAHDVKFFLFANGLTLFSGGRGLYKDLTYCVINYSLTYENGANVNTGFITNILPKKGILLCGELEKRLREAQQGNKGGEPLPKNVMSSQVITAARLKTSIIPGRDFLIPAEVCVPTKSIGGYPLFGGGFVIPECYGAQLKEREREREPNLQERAVMQMLNAKYPTVMG